MDTIGFTASGLLGASTTLGIDRLQRFHAGVQDPDLATTATRLRPLSYA